MCGRTDGINVGFSSERFPAGTHMCLVYRDEAERTRIASSFVESGIADGERVSYFADGATRAEVTDWLASLDVDVSDALNAQAFTVAEAAATYCPDGTFVPARMLETLKGAYESACREGYPASRVTGEMSWALRGLPGSEYLMDYEAQVNRVLETHPITAMCQYDANRFDGNTIFAALQVHPYMVMNGQLVKNPYYVLEE